MEGTEEPHMNKHKKIMNDWNHDATSTLTLYSILDLQNLSSRFSLYYVSMYHFHH